MANKGTRPGAASGQFGLVLNEARTGEPHWCGLKRGFTSSA
jgi:hypothetical protein